MEAIRYLLDNNALSYLFGHSNVPEATLQNVRKRLLKKKTADPDCVIGGVNLLEELAGIAISNPTQFKQIMTFVPALFNGRTLEPWYDRMYQEVETGKPVPPAEAFLNASDESLVLDEWRRRRDVSPRVMDRKLDYKNGSDEARAGVFGRIQPGKSSNQPVKGSKKVAEEWFSEFHERKQSWFQDRWAIMRRNRNLSDDPQFCPAVNTLPVSHAWVTYNLTKMYQIHGLGRGNDKGDLYDLAHFIDGCNADYLVTDDKGFREICDLAKWRPFQHITFQEFCEKVLKN